ncbi:MAG: sulfite exporter TauE/SafE family protein [Paracoccus sp. (in: a-proteobacteria)]|uniref:sulfite exporter TauE/SafE family protein n=1 Tax=Paracoccus sp. TaxID=267 RepID=UPI0026E00CE9|nr:sulfite exporter TauE/SafE family protein [Paracoccus sp. (in: a-proteobacteria)]MDO5630591.1 sulfite exporter TauE/SafE family protein [Paracoccus sp. (in: a-proteobacteria)]
MFGLDPVVFWAAMAVTLFAGFVKGAVGFAMPMIMMSVFGSMMPATMALAGLILPTLVTNIGQAFRWGPAEAWAATACYRWHIGAVALFILVSAPFAAMIPQGAMYLMLGAPITAFALWQLSGRPLALPIRHQRRAEVVSGVIGGLYGGISGIWGPPLIVYLLSVGVPKREQVLVQGVVFLLGAVVLSVAHLFTGILSGPGLAFSAALIVPAVIGLRLGFALQDRLDVVQFRRWTLVLLVLTGANLIRRAVQLGI